MGRKAKYSKKFKLEIVKRYFNGEYVEMLVREYGMPKNGRRTITEWANKFKSLGESTLESINKNKKYSNELKLIVVKKIGFFKEYWYI